MNQPALAQTLLSHEDYLAMELTSQVKHEYVAGNIYAMTGTSDIHNIISLNIASILRNHLKEIGRAHV